MPRGILRNGRGNNSYPPRRRNVSWLHSARVNLYGHPTSMGTQPTNTVTNAFSGLNPSNSNMTNNLGGGNNSQLEGADPNLQVLADIMAKLSMNQNHQLSQILQQQAQMQQQKLAAISGNIKDAISSTSSSMAKATQLANFDKLPILKGREPLHEVKVFFHRFETFAQGLTHNESLNILQTKLEGHASRIFEEATNVYGNNFDEIKGYLLNKLGRNDLKKEQYFHELTNGVTNGIKNH